MLANLYEILCLAGLALLAQDSLPIGLFLAIAFFGVSLLLPLNRFWRWVNLLLVICVNLVTLGDAVYGRMYGDPLSPADFWDLASILPQLIGAAGSEWDWAMGGILWLALSPMVVLAIYCFRVRATPTIKTPARLAYPAFLFLFLFLGRDSLLIGKIVKEVFVKPDISALTNVDLKKAQAFYEQNKQTSLYGQPEGGTPFSFSLMNDSRQKKNIILVMMESIGSEQLFTDHALNAEVAPFLANFPGKMGVLDQVYVPGPATIYTHYELLTGSGNTVWGGVPKFIKEKTFNSSLVHQFVKAGYTTGVFSATNFTFSNLGILYEKLPFDLRQYPEKMPEDIKAKYKNNHWGLDERPIIKEAVDWLHNQKKPTFMMFLNSSAHAPYNIPSDFPLTFTGDSKLEHYKNCLRFIDSTLKLLFDQLTEKGMAKNTVVILVGDHGEGFRLWHHQDYGHGAHLYETTGKTYAAFLQLQPEHEFKTDSRVVDIKKLSAWIADSALNSKTFETKKIPEGIAFFKSRNLVPQLGLRDGRWKFHFALGTHRVPRLFDLHADPHELNNIADLHPEMISRYQELSIGWFFTELQADSMKFADGHGKQMERKIEKLSRGVSLFGPQDIRCGVFSKNQFQEREKINPSDTLMCRIYSVGYANRGDMELVWIGPQNFRKSVRILKDRGWEEIDQFLNSDAPMNEGAWKVEVYSDKALAIAGTFSVSKSAEALQPRRFQNASKGH